MKLVFPNASQEQMLIQNAYQKQKRMEQQFQAKKPSNTPNVLTTGYDKGLMFKSEAEWSKPEEDIPSASHRMRTPPSSPIRDAPQYNREDDFDGWWAECWEHGWAHLDLG